MAGSTAAPPAVIVMVAGFSFAYCFLFAAAAAVVLVLFVVDHAPLQSFHPVGSHRLSQPGAAKALAFSPSAVH